VLVEGLSVRDEKRMGELDSAQTPQLTGRTMCDRIVVFDAPLRLVGRIVDVDVVSSAAWSLSGVVADGLADAVPLDGLRFGAEPQPLYQIATSLPGRPAGG
jgi:tRNA-2-methylthio-N6-dimethylallyladenosine synthase